MVLCVFHSFLCKGSVEDCDLRLTDCPGASPGKNALRDVISATLSGMQGPRHVTATAASHG
jgi:hypothetical protein